jgi:hypothetical protein
VDDLLGTVSILDNKSVKVVRAADLELGEGTAVLLDGDGLDVLSAGKVEESLDVGSLTLMLVGTPVTCLCSICYHWICNKIEMKLARLFMTLLKSFDWHVQC